MGLANSESLHTQILTISIEHWVDRAVGITAYDLAEKLKIDHNVVKKEVKVLQKAGKGSLNENAKFYVIEVPEILNGEPINQFFEKRKLITTHVFFPSKSILEENYLQNLLLFKDLGEYDVRLKRGFGQLDFFYFESSALKKFFDKQNQYEIEDGVTGGRIGNNSAYYNSLSEEEQENLPNSYLRYGKRKLRDGNYCIVAFLCDLEKLGISEQRYWHSYELFTPTFATPDENFLKFVGIYIHGEWIDTNDPLHDLTKALSRLNELFPNDPIFKHTNNQYLKYPVLGTEKEFCDCCSELFKLIDNATLDAKNLKKILSGMSNDPLVDEKGKDYFAKKYFELFIKIYSEELQEKFTAVYSQIKENRIVADHKITKPELGSPIYRERFNSYCQILRDVIEQLIERIEQYPVQTKLKNP